VSNEAYEIKLYTYFTVVRSVVIYLVQLGVSRHKIIYQNELVFASW